MNKVIDKGFRSCRFVSTIVKHPVLLNPDQNYNFTYCSKISNHVDRRAYMLTAEKSTHRTSGKKRTNVSKSTNKSKVELPHFQSG